MSRDLIDYVTLVVSVLLALVGLGGIGVAVYTLKAIRQQAELAKETLTLQFRPKLIVRSVRLLPARITADANGLLGTTYDIEYVITNTGGSPAQVEELVAGTRLFPNRPLPLPNYKLWFGKEKCKEKLLPAAHACLRITCDERTGANLSAHGIQWPEAFEQIHFLGYIRFTDDGGLMRSMGFAEGSTPPLNASSR